jgi:hypothetical protein
MPATCFATPTFVFAAPVLRDADAHGRAKALRYRITVRLKPDPTDNGD